MTLAPSPRRGLGEGRLIAARLSARRARGCGRLCPARMGAPPPLVGYNTNVRHKGKLFHIQTEDSGIAKPHVITHLFADGGRIVATRKTQYTEHVAAPDREDIVRRIMKEQHKAMFIALRDGVYDGPDAAPVAAPPAPVVADATTRSPTPHSGVITGFDPALSVEGIATPVDPSVVPATSDRAPAPAAAPPPRSSGPAPAAPAPRRPRPHRRARQGLRPPDHRREGRHAGRTCRGLGHRHDRGEPRAGRVPVGVVDRPAVRLQAVRRRAVPWPLCTRGRTPVPAHRQHEVLTLIGLHHSKNRPPWAVFFWLDRSEALVMRPIRIYNPGTCNQPGFTMGQGD